MPHGARDLIQRAHGVDRTSTKKNEKEKAMGIERWNPRHVLARGKRTGPFTSLDDMFAQFLRGELPTFSAGEGESRMVAPAMDVIDRKDELVVRADLPGLEQKDVQVEIRDGKLTLRGERSEEHEEKAEDYYHAERWEGSFYRTLDLPPGVDTDRAEAKFKNGVLEIHLPKSKETKGKKIEIKAS
jgi:HSP20 family protein